MGTRTTTRGRITRYERGVYAEDSATAAALVEAEVERDGLELLPRRTEVAWTGRRGLYRVVAVGRAR